MYSMTYLFYIGIFDLDQIKFVFKAQILKFVMMFGIVLPLPEKCYLADHSRLYTGTGRQSQWRRRRKLEKFEGDGAILG